MESDYFPVSNQGLILVSRTVEEHWPAVMSSEHWESIILSDNESAEKPANWTHTQTERIRHTNVLQRSSALTFTSNSPLWSERLLCVRRPTWPLPALPPWACRWTRGHPSLHLNQQEQNTRLGNQFDYWLMFGFTRFLENLFEISKVKRLSYNFVFNIIWTNGIWCFFLTLTFIYI